MWDPVGDRGIRRATTVTESDTADRHLVPEAFPPQVFAHPNTMNVNDLLEIDITDVALGGKALARHEGRAVFVDRGLPGDRVRARVTRVRRTWPEARLERVESSMALRVDAGCQHFVSGVCGGYRNQADHAAQAVGGVLRRMLDEPGLANPRRHTLLLAF